MNHSAARVAAHRLFEVIDRKSTIDYKSEKVSGSGSVLQPNDVISAIITYSYVPPKSGGYFDRRSHMMFEAAKPLSKVFKNKRKESKNGDPYSATIYNVEIRDP